MNRYELITAPTGNPVTTAEAKTFLNIDHSSDDTLIASLITTATKLYETRTNRQLVAAVWRLHMDRFPTSAKLPIIITKAPVLFVRQIKYVDADDLTYNVWGSGTQEVKVFPGSVQSGDVFTIKIAGITMATFTATAATIPNVTAGLQAHWAISTNPSAYKTNIQATDATDYLSLTSLAPGENFDITTSTTNGGSTDSQTLTISYTTAAQSVYMVDSPVFDRFCRIMPFLDDGWPDTDEIAFAGDTVPPYQNSRLFVDFAAGYGAAADVPEMHKTAIKQIVADLYEHRGMMTEKELFGSRAYERLEWAGKVPEFA